MDGPVSRFDPPTTFKLQAEPARARQRKTPQGKRENCGRRRQPECAAGAFYACCVEPADPQELSFRHSGWWQTRARIRTHLANSGWNAFKLDRWDQCGSACVAEWSPSLQRHRLRANYCHSRHCRPCSRAKGTRLALNLRARLAERPRGRYRFVTLTLVNSHKDLGGEIARLYAAFKQLRTRQIWKSQRGGCFILEVKWTQERGWHPHLHIITEGDWIPQNELSQEWYKVTGDSYIVDVRPLSTTYDPADYVAKYVTKGVNAEVWQSDDAAQEWISASKGVRAAATFGDWRGFALCRQPAQANDWQPVGRLTKILAAARAAEPWALAIVKSLRATALLEVDELFTQPPPDTAGSEIPPWTTSLPPPRREW
jgi:hypothetical protein